MWYFLDNGVPRGPLSTAEINELVSQRKIAKNELLYREGAMRWKPLSQWIEFHPNQPNLETEELASSKVRVTEAAEWIVLSRSNLKGTKQRGPWTEQEVKARLTRGEVKSSDFIWKPGFIKWLKIEDVFVESGREEVNVKSPVLDPEANANLIGLVNQAFEKKAVEVKGEIKQDDPKIVALPVGVQSKFYTHHIGRFEDGVKNWVAIDPDRDMHKNSVLALIAVVILIAAGSYLYKYIFVPRIDKMGSILQR